MKRKDYLQILWFLIKFNVLAIPMYLLIYLNVSFPLLEKGIASFTSSFLGMMGYESSVDSSSIYIVNGNEIQAINISTDSTGWKSMYLLASLVIATSKGLMKRKVSFLLLAVPIVFVLNIVRIVSTISFSLSFGFNYFEVLHKFLWREGLIFAVLILWIFFLTKENIIRYKSKLFV